LQGFFQGVLGTRFGSLEFQIRSLESENYHRVPKIRKNRVRKIREIGSLHIQTGFLTFSLKKTGIWYNDAGSWLWYCGNQKNKKEAKFSESSIYVFETNLIFM